MNQYSSEDLLRTWMPTKMTFLSGTKTHNFAEFTLEKTETKLIIKGCVFILLCSLLLKSCLVGKWIQKKTVGENC